MSEQTLTQEVVSGLQAAKDGFLKGGVLAWTLLLLFVALFFEPFQFIWTAWTKENGYYSHGPLVPLVSVYMVILQRKKLEALSIKPSWWGVPLLVFCGLGFLASTLCHMYPPKYFLFVFYVLGFNLLLFGWDVVKTTVAPWAFLFFMVPLPDAVIDLFTYRLRIFVTGQAVALTEPFNWFIVRSGNFILYPDGDMLVVEDVCAGLRSLIGLLAVGACFAFISKLPMAGKWILFFFSAPVAVVTNVIRIFCLIVVGKYFGAEVASGKVHDASGWLIYVVAVAILYAMNLVLERVFKKWAPPSPEEAPA